LLDQLASEIRLHAPSFAHSIWLRAEVDNARVRADIYVKYPDGRIVRRDGRDRLRIILRELWSEFLLAGQGRWWGLTVHLGSTGERQVTYDYVDQNQPWRSPDVRRLAWISQNLPGGQSYQHHAAE